MLTIRKVSIVVLAVASAGLAACGKSGSAVATQDELQRDLELASAATMNLAAARVDSSLLAQMETAPQGTPEVSKTVKKGAGPRAVRSEVPTVLATPDVDVAAVEESEEVQTESIAPAPQVAEPVAVAPRPAPVVIPASTGGDYGSGGGIFGGAGSGGGVVIRGGGVDGDNCELHRRPRGGVTSSGPVYIPSTATRPGGVYGGARGARGSIGATMRPAVSGASGARSATRTARRGE